MRPARGCRAPTDTATPTRGRHTKPGPTRSGASKLPTSRATSMPASCPNWMAAATTLLGMLASPQAVLGCTCPAKYPFCSDDWCYTDRQKSDYTHRGSCGTGVFSTDCTRSWSPPCTGGTKAPGTSCSAHCNRRPGCLGNSVDNGDCSCLRADGTRAPVTITPPSPSPPTPTPSCPAGCPTLWRGDGDCDNSCNNAACNHDDGDCRTPSPSPPTPTPSCPAGRYQSSSSQNCIACPAQKYSSSTGSTSCSSCLSGRSGYSENGWVTSGATQCKAFTCEPGRYRGSHDCYPCQPGRYQSSRGFTGSSCTLCAVGRYRSSRSGTSSSSCSSCSSGKTTSGHGRTSSSDCKSTCEMRGCPTRWRGDGDCDNSCNNAACNHDDGDCRTPCGPGKYMITSGCANCPAGQYSSSTDRSTSCSLCPAGQYQPSVGSTSISSCSTCEQGKFDTDDRKGCSSCPSGQNTTSSGKTSSSDCYTPCTCMTCSYRNEDDWRSWGSKPKSANGGACTFCTACASSQCPCGQSSYNGGSYCNQCCPNSPSTFTYKDLSNCPAVASPTPIATPTPPTPSSTGPSTLSSPSPVDHTCEPLSGWTTGKYANLDGKRVCNLGSAAVEGSFEVVMRTCECNLVRKIRIY
eukprot:COSAG01_NODE_1602_length_9759_cov_35.078157_5_plen_630_part_00